MSGPVTITLTGNGVNFSKVENFAPYSLFGDGNGGTTLAARVSSPASTPSVPMPTASLSRCLSRCKPLQAPLARWCSS